ncbi:MAG: hypothetical protein JSS02_09575 [Planctomycetes bacterium]|nr:hypothetical protein [Planctomycetota bacterium]
MYRYWLSAVCWLFLTSAVPAAEPAVADILAKAVQSLGGEAKVAKAMTCRYEAQGKIVLGNFEGAAQITVTMDGLTRRRAEFEGEFAGNRYRGVTVLNGENGWRKFADMGSPLDKELLANEKRLVYMQQSLLTLGPLRNPAFQVTFDGEELVNAKPALALQVQGPDQKDFKIWFDKVSGLPVKLVGRVLEPQGGLVTQETTAGDYQDVNGWKYARKIEIRRDGQPFAIYQVSTFTVLEKVDPQIFAEPE